jgi:hypothetical protein
VKTRNITILFDDGSKCTYDIRVPEGFEYAVNQAQDNLYAKLKQGKNIRPPMNRKEMRKIYGDLRQFNGNHATGAGKKPVHNPGPKAVGILRVWDEVA